MNAFHHKHIIVVHLESLAALLTLAALEIVLRQFHLLTTEEGIKLVVDLLKVEGIDTLIIIFSILVLRRSLAIDKIVIERNLQRFQSVDSQLYGETLARSRLTRRRRSSQEDEFHPRPCCYLLGYLGYLLLLKRLADIDNIRGMARINSRIEVAHCSDADNILPVMMLLEDFEHLVLTGYLAQFIRVLERRNAQQHAVVILLQPEEIELRGVGEERAIIEVYVFTYFIIGSIERARSAQQLHLLHITFLLEEGYGVLGRHHIAADRHTCIHDFLHSLTDAVHIIGRNITFQSHIDIKPFDTGMSITTSCPG